MKICIIASNYPSKGNPKHVFLEKIVKEFVDSGNECTVIAPQSGKKIRKEEDVYFSNKGISYRVYSPMYHNYSGRKIGPVNFGIFTQKSFQKSVERTITGNSIECDVFYSHFISAGTAANYMSKKTGKPFFMANGESDLKKFILTLNAKEVKETYRRVSAIISVSTANKNETINCGYFDPEEKNKIYVLPNGIDPNFFHPGDKKQARKKLGFPEDVFITAFVGQFSERKGAGRVAEALKQCEDVYSVFIGSGPDVPEHDKCLYKGRVDNKLVCLYLNAADVFVLPTLNEGCSNAIVEAMACGLPIISSDKDFNYDILDESCGILIDPENIDEIAEAINKCKNSPELLASYSRACLNKVSSLTLTKRAEKIIEIMSK